MGFENQYAKVGQTAQQPSSDVSPDMCVDPLLRESSIRGQSDEVRRASRLSGEDASASSSELLGNESAEAIGRDGIIYKKEGANLRDEASPSPKAVAVRLPFNTPVYVSSQSDGFYFVATRDGRFGHVAVSHVKIGLPEPNARIHHIESGDTALSISRAYYGGEAKWGADHRFFVNGLVHVNEGDGDRGIYKPRAEDDWDTTQVRAGYMIWVPDVGFMQALRGQVESGSITHDAWSAAVASVEAIGEFLLGAGAFTVGLVHGALESVWDIFVGLKDLALLAADLVRWVCQLVAGDGKSLYEALSELDLPALVAGWLDDLDGKWHADGLLERWHFRGWLVGYVIAEVLMLFFSGGVINGIKWAGKASKLSKVVAQLPKITKISQAAKDSKLGQAFTKALKGSHGGKASAALKTAGRWVDEPASIWGKGPDEIADALREAGYTVRVQQSTKGSKLSVQVRVDKAPEGAPPITNIQVHPGGGRHGGSYYKISTSDQGKIWVVDGAFKADPGMKGKVVSIDSGPSGWLLQVLAANSGVQRIGRGDEDE